eukprot:m.121940 g.121940  ORF g.121940 m.121940 type:complete len:175 (-) comp21930_c0_seq1:585-1109(-)
MLDPAIPDHHHPRAHCWYSLHTLTRTLCPPHLSSRVECYSEDLDRWVHMDCCENAWDSPLMYERGWGKKLSYIFSFTKGNVTDTTWRYSKDVAGSCSRRGGCGEAELVLLLEEINTELHRRHPDTTPAETDKRRIVELCSFLSDVKEVSASELLGRQSGSEEWRRARGEIGLAP